jgi:hypothetical protein
LPPWQRHFRYHLHGLDDRAIFHSKLVRQRRSSEIALNTVFSEEVSRYPGQHGLCSRWAGPLLAYRARVAPDNAHCIVESLYHTHSDRSCQRLCAVSSARHDSEINPTELCGARPFVAKHHAKGRTATYVLASCHAASELYRIVSTESDHSRYCAPFIAAKPAH